MKSLGRNEFWWMEALSYTTDAFVGKLLEQFDNRWQSSKADWNTGAALKMVMQRDIDRLLECRNDAVADADRVKKIVEAEDRQDVGEFASGSVCRKGMEFAVVGAVYYTHSRDDDTDSALGCRLALEHSTRRT